MASRQLSQRDILDYADLTHDHNPLHVDPAYAASGPFGGIVAHGFFILAPVLADIAGEPLPRALTVRFRQPLRPGGVASSEWSDVTGEGAFQVRDRDEVLAEGTCVPIDGTEQF
jgi:acyl dehydratase